ncbi:hypothetical protein A3F27_02115 [Candidatus Kaiserbacteria bacterium RIFCSPHIGHO2_12_FULL_53_13]|uniref:Endolytic murein transglycosylase n=1 Tax=Candidatus Kaiserbacteria bacterium RIFCSPHIGHO2_12_FULL_53_13 TaxID=1798502 RepID=A0A1F6EC82_9BACT|nr:MAG: hypothetical protein A3F27_02115 [Candidatus Kaiserbacteria bacterium RIFCSPHIGHO2_12_FULL_53_13]OGG74456.1 MAG: hypothetical protein A3A37_02285 [Candidatus Kaiserbacteria bacterium RIFCSPLOWO2_01_FULL_52_36]
MHPLQRSLERAFAMYERMQEELSAEWRENANRRTTLILVVAGAVATLLYLSVVRPPDDFPLGELVTIPQGASLQDTSVILEEAGVVRMKAALRALVFLMGHQRDVHAGDYLFKEPRGLFSVARAISIGAYGLEPMRILIPEGATTGDMAVIFGNRLLRFDAERFLADARSQEGYLFPDTYFFLPNAAEDLVIRTMRQNFDSHEASIDAQVQAFGKPLGDVVIMASLLEREAKTMEDRRMIAGVLWNRLNRGMLLQVDAAFLYSLGRNTYQLTTEDLASDSPYNTYRYKGLPPGPIGSPSMISLEAAVTPVKHDYLYYLADRNGKTYFSKTYAEHLRNKQRYVDR